MLAVIMVFFAIVSASTALAATSQEFRADYQVLVDGKPRLETTIEMTRQGDFWVLSSEGRGTKGLARMLGVRSAESARIEHVGDTFRPVEFSHHSRVAGRDERWSAGFDHGKNEVELIHEEGSSSFEISPGTWDPLSLTLELRRRLAAGVTNFEVRVADEDEIDTHRYRAGTPRQIKTSVGCLAVIELERVRENSSRYSRGWYAVEYDFMPVRIQHGKTGGKDFDMRIRQLVIAGKNIQSPKACPR